MSLPNVAYFSMEIAIDQSLATYSGGLGFLAGSHMQSAGYLQLPMVGVTMLWSYGYYDQRIDHTGNVEVAYIRKYYDYLEENKLREAMAHFANMFSGTMYPNALVFIISECPELYSKMTRFVSEIR